MFRRTLAVLAASVLVLVGCDAADQVRGELRATLDEVASEASEAVVEHTSPDGGATASPSPEGGADPSGGDPGTGSDGGAPTGGDATEGSGDAGGEAVAPATPADDLAGVGANGRAYLRGDRTRLVVEVDVQEGARIDEAALEHLLGTIRQVADKPDGVTLSGGNTFRSDRREWTAADLRAAAQEHRQHHTDASTAAMYVLVVRGGFHAGGSETNAIGVAHNASEVAIFPDRYAGLTGVLGSDRAIARAVLVHEFGHLLGLVNLTYESEIDHEDPDHPGHSSNRGSVMYHAIETTLIGQVFSGPPPDTFDDADLADIEGLRTGRY